MDEHDIAEDQEIKKVSDCICEFDGKVLVEGINVVKKHTKPSVANQNGGIVEKEAPVDISNVMYVHKGTPTRVGFKEVDGKKVRFAKSTGDVID